MDKLTIVKIGGKVVDDENQLDQFLQDFVSISGHKMLIHGGGKVASDFGKQLGIEPNYIDGRRITDKATLNLVTMVYGGLVNKNIVAKLQAMRQNALGLSGADANILPAVKREVKDIDYGFVGDVKTEEVNSSQLQNLLESGLSLVFCPLTHDQKGSLLNTNADTVASVLASALSTLYDVNLVYCFEQKGVLSDFENEVIIPQITNADYQELRDIGVIIEGMIPKMDNAFDSLRGGVKCVTIGHFSQVQILAQGGEAGTKITMK